MRQPIVKDTYVKATLNTYDQSIYVNTDIGVSGPGYDSAHTVFTLPNGEIYDGTADLLEVFCNEALWEEGIHYSYTNSTNATTITTLSVIPRYTRIRFRKIY